MRTPTKILFSKYGLSANSNVSLSPHATPAGNSSEEISTRYSRMPSSFSVSCNTH